MRTRAWFDPHGPLATRLPNYRIRGPQVEMAQAVAAAVEQGETLIVEAGTGTGKSIAYLVPAMLSGGKIIVSTGTKNLQDQLFNKDIPGLLAVGNYQRRVSLLKGRSNYLCFHRLRQAQEDPKLIRQRSTGGNSSWLTLRSLMTWGMASEEGDLSAADAPRMEGIPLARVTSTRENCLGSDCPDYADCFVLKARRRAQEADIVVVNHHLLLADLVLREEGFAEILPDADAIILDEAHQLPEVATQFFGQRYSYHQLADVARDLRSESRLSGTDLSVLKTPLSSYEAACAALQQALSGGNQRMAWLSQASGRNAAQAIENFHAAVDALKVALVPVRVHSKGLETAAERVEGISRFFAQLRDEAREHIRWIDRTERGFILHITPLEVADQFRRIMQQASAAWIMTSATLTVGRAFNHFVAQMGAEDARTLMLDSPFDYLKRALMYLPRISAAPNHPAFQDEVVERILPVIEAASGGAFVLCTSLQAVTHFAEALRRHLDMRILVQGEGGKDALLNQFREDGNAVLVATSSFWEGVDVQGHALRLVIIDRLPFAHPGDPVLKARLDAIQARQGSPFFEHQVPQAVIGLKQGVGRLIRDHDDRGVIMICDPRLTTKAYGKMFLSSLPEMPRTHLLEDVKSFFAEVVS